MEVLDTDTYDESGQLLLMESDSGPDGVVDLRIAFFLYPPTHPKVESIPVWPNAALWM